MASPFHPYLPGRLTALPLLLLASSSLKAQNEPPPPPPDLLVAKYGNACAVFQQQNWDADKTSLRMVLGSTAWTVDVDNVGIKGPWIHNARVSAAGSPHRFVLKEAGLAEILVPYHNGAKPLYDLQWASVLEIGNDELPPVGGGLLRIQRPKIGGGFEPDPVPRMGVECRERGIDWFCHEKGVKLPTKRGYEVVLFAVIDSGNYDNLLQYIFRDDGTIAFRIGTSGYLNDDAAGLYRGDHMHTQLWRIVPLVVNNNTRIYAVRNVEKTVVNTITLLTEFVPGASIVDTEITHESQLDWEPQHFLSLMVKSNSQKNKWGSARGYELVPYGVTGISRHAKTGSQSDGWTLHDFWVTKEKASENIRFNWSDPSEHLMPILNNEALSPGPKVIWYRSSFLHHVTDHDRDSNGNDAIVSAHWTGFDFHPHNFFDFNPMTGGAGKCKQ